MCHFELSFLEYDSTISKHWHDKSRSRWKGNVGWYNMDITNMHMFVSSSKNHGGLGMHIRMNSRLIKIINFKNNITMNIIFMIVTEVPKWNILPCVVFLLMTQILWGGGEPCTSCWQFCFKRFDYAWYICKDVCLSFKNTYVLAAVNAVTSAHRQLMISPIGSSVAPSYKHRETMNHLKTYSILMTLTNSYQDQPSFLRSIANAERVEYHTKWTDNWCCGLSFILDWPITPIIICRHWCIWCKQQIEHKSMWKKLNT